MDRTECAIFLDDLVWEKFGLGSYCVINRYVAGQVIESSITHTRSKM